MANKKKKAKKKKTKTKRRAVRRLAGALSCQQDDRDQPGMVCGYPLPCPYHTAVIDTTADPPTVVVPTRHPKAVAATPRLAQMGNAIKDIFEQDAALPSCKPGDKLTAELNADGIVEIRKNGAPFIFMSEDAFRWFRRAKLRGAPPA